MRARSVLVAPDSFKGSVASRPAAHAIRSGWLRAAPHDDVVVVPIADGGEGTLDALSDLPGARWMTATAVTGPDGRIRDAPWLLLPDGTAIIELAAGSGLPLMRRPDPLGATSRGLGDVIRAAMDHGATRLIIGLGGSASTDGAAGALSALGMRFADGDGAALCDGGAHLRRLASRDASRMLPPPPGGVTLLTDVDSPLLGGSGSAAIFGPQKGADARQVAELEAGLECLAVLLGGDPHAPGAGAAGGVAFGLATVWGAHLVSGFDWIAGALGLEDKIRTADVTVTGEGRLDAQSLLGKVVGRVHNLTRSSNRSMIAIVGQQQGAAEFPVVALDQLSGDASASMSDPLPWLERAGSIAARL